jgi:wyosine [tRNA(Phe)-imidazoG37] synthetase (radical SAM superfamily)
MIMYVYGPVPSRRLGNSLGVSPIPPKTCSYTCVYCQLGRTTHLQTKRKRFFPREDILSEILKVGKNTTPDYVTFVGDGEPTLCRDLGWLIKNTNDQLQTPIAVITNGSLLFLDDVRSELKHARIVMPTLDAGNEETFRAINRPHRDISFDKMLNGLVDFRNEYSGQIWLEVMLVKGINDQEKELHSIKKAIERIKPDRIYIMTPIRPPAESWVEQSDYECIIKAQDILGESIPISGLERGQFGTEEFSNAEQAILEIGSRHPLRRSQALEIEAKFSQSGVVEQMLASKKLISINYKNEEYLLPRYFKMGRQSTSATQRLA